MDRLVALALVKPEGVVSDPEGTKREARILGRVGAHDNIVSVYDYEVDADSSAQYIVLEYLAGGRLADELPSQERSLEEILLLARQICRGLAHLHGEGILHRDISPANVFFDQRHNAHLGDFDSAITIDNPTGLRPITTNSFAAPEELAGKPLDVRSDLYSVGALLYVVATGADRPFDVRLLRQQRPDLPSSFGDLVMSLLSRSPDSRPPDVGTVLRQLDEIRRDSSLDAFLAADETETIEFKSSLHHRHEDLPPGLKAKVESNEYSLQLAEKDVKKALPHAVTKSIAAFLNTKGGTLLIGVSNARNVLGIEHDFAYLREGQQDGDGWLLSLQQTITNNLGPDVWNAIRVSLVPQGEGTVAVISCPRRTRETWHQDEDRERFYIRTSNATLDLNGSELIKYIREHWPA
jgi:serine/threonine protein kinase